MRVKDAMTRKVVGVLPRATVAEALDLMMRSRVSGLPVIDEAGSLVGIVSEGDFLRRSEFGTAGPELHWLKDLFLPGQAAKAYARTHGRYVNEIMSRDVTTIGEDTRLEEAVALMEQHHVQRLPVVAGDKVVGIITRADFVRELVEFVRQSYDKPLTSDAEIKERIKAELRTQHWAPVASIDILVQNGVVNLHGLLTDEQERDAIRVIAENVSGVREVHDHIRWVEGYSGTTLLSPEDNEKGRAA
jgi:CBS domain-containing protein